SCIIEHHQPRVGVVGVGLVAAVRQDRVQRLDLEPLVVVRAREADRAPPAARRALDPGVVVVTQTAVVVVRLVTQVVTQSTRVRGRGLDEGYHRAPSRMSISVSRLSTRPTFARSASASRTAAATTGPCFASFTSASRAWAECVRGSSLRAAAARFVRFAT